VTSLYKTALSSVHPVPRTVCAVGNVSHRRTTMTVDSCTHGCMPSCCATILPVATRFDMMDVYCRMLSGGGRLIASATSGRLSVRA
jgi:hypothetical protein